MVRDSGASAPAYDKGDGRRATCPNLCGCDRRWVLGRLHVHSGRESRRILLTSAADAQLKELSKSANEVYICELLAAVATIHRLRTVSRGRKLISFVDNGASRVHREGGPLELP